MKCVAPQAGQEFQLPAAPLNITKVDDAMAIVRSYFDELADVFRRNLAGDGVVMHIRRGLGPQIP